MIAGDGGVPRATRAHSALLRARSVAATPGAILLDGEVVGAWQRQQRKVTIHPWSDLSTAVRETIETEAVAFPIAGSSTPSVAWD